MASRGTATRQRGVALIAVLAFIGIVAAVFVLRSLDADTLRAQQSERTARALEQAREALIAYAATNETRPGSLPCPDLDGDGRSLPVIEYQGGNDNQCVNYIGRLPWALLRIPELRDGSGELLWYALSPAFRNSGLDNPGFVNPDTPAMLTVAGMSGTFAAIVFAPGAALQGQDRSIASANLVFNYLDGVNSTPTTSFSAALPGATFNDRLLPVRAADLMTLAEQRVARQVAAALDDYFSLNGFLPAPAPFDSPGCVAAGTTTGCLPGAGPLAGRIPANIVPDAYSASSSGRPNALLRGDPTDPSWFQTQRWREQAIYMVSPECVGPPETKCQAGSLNLRGAAGGNVDNARFVILMGGIAGAGQPRITEYDRSQLENYLEGSALAAAGALRGGSVPPAITVPAGTAAATSRMN